MGLSDFFSRRRRRESAIPEPEALGSFANPEGQPVVGQQASGVAGVPAGPIDLSNLGSMIQSAIDSGNAQIEQMPPQTFDMRGSGLREEILGIMKQHGIDPETGTASNVNAGDYGDMQQQIIAALSKHGLDLGGTTPQIQVEPQDPADSGS